MAPSGTFHGWRVVAGSGFGIAFGSVIFASGAFPQLASAWGREFAWSQPQLAKAATIFLFLQMLTFPVFGWLLDRWGSRRIASASIALFALALVALSHIENSLAQFYAAFALIGLVSAGTNVVSYARAISLWFDRKRGLALGIAAGSQALGSVLVPMLTAKLIASAGWSAAVLSLAAVEVVVCLPLVWLLVRDSPVPYGQQPDGDAAPARAAKAVIAGPGAARVIRSTTFWKLALCFVAMGLTAYAILINVVFILGKTAGLTPAEVAKVQAAAGISVLVGRVGFGYLLDRLHAPLVGMLAIACSALGILAYATAPSFAVVMIGSLLIGCSIGGESDLMPYLASRYFGTRALSTVFGWFLAAFFVGGAIGPTAFATIAAAHDSAVFPLYLLLGLQVLPVALFLLLGRYPTPAELEAASAGADPATPPAALAR
jgi:MFS family permease